MVSGKCPRINPRAWLVLPAKYALRFFCCDFGHLAVTFSRNGDFD